jgi:tRNA-dihydrouridine synthase
MAGRPPREVTPEDRKRFLLEYIDLLVREAPWGEEDLRKRGEKDLRSRGASAPRRRYDPAATHERWVVNKLRALCGYYTKGFEGGAHLRVAVNQAPSVGALRTLIEEFFAAQRDIASD